MLRRSAGIHLDRPWPGAEARQLAGEDGAGQPFDQLFLFIRGQWREAGGMGRRRSIARHHGFDRGPAGHAQRLSVLGSMQGVRRHAGFGIPGGRQRGRADE